MRVGTADLRNRLSFFLQKIREGRRVVVTDHGRPIAQLVPIDRADDLEGRIRELVEDGLVTALPLRKRREARPIKLSSEVQVSRLVSSMRDEG